MFITSTFMHHLNSMFILLSLIFIILHYWLLGFIVCLTHFKSIVTGNIILAGECITNEVTIDVEVCAPFHRLEASFLVAEPHFD